VGRFDVDPELTRADGFGLGAAKSIVAMSSLPGARVPQEEQKRTPPDNSLPQDMQEGITFPDTVYREELTSGVGPLTSRTSDLSGPQVLKSEVRASVVYYHPDNELAPRPLAS
jgi:hypothetical protein